MGRLVALLGVLLLLAASAVTAAAMPRGGRTSQPPARLMGTDVWPAGMRPAPGFALHDQNGRLITRSGLRGQVWAITFLDSQCHEQCPVEAHALGYVWRQLGPRYPWKLVIVSLQPGYDTPVRVRAFARKTGLGGDWHWLLGARRALMPVWRAYGIGVQSADVHTTALYLVDRQGDVRVADAIPFIPSQLEASVRALVGRRGG